jgi:hypothetical protein
LFLLACSAHAGTDVYHSHTFSSLGDSACPTGSPGNAPDGGKWGISLAGLRGWTVVICPVTDGAYFTGSGTLNVCTFSAEPWGPGQWALSPRFAWTMTSDDVSTEENPCLSFEHTETHVDLSDRVFVYPSGDFGISSGGMVVKLYGAKR